MEIENKTAVVTGGGSGIGEQISRRIAAEGGKVVIVDVRQANAERVASSIGPNAIALHCDVAIPSAVDAMAEQAWSAWKGVDIVFANAGIGRSAPLLEATPEEFDFLTGINQRGVWLTFKAFANKMISEDRQGHLCLTGSEHSLGFQHAGSGIYTASKHAVLGMGDVLRHELPASIGVSVLCPGLVHTNLSTSGDHGSLPPVDPEALAFANTVLAEGMDPALVAKAAVDGVKRGEFLIVTHPSAFEAARVRFDEIRTAFDRQAPMYEGAEQLHVNNAMARVIAKQGSGG